MNKEKKSNKNLSQSDELLKKAILNRHLNERSVNYYFNVRSIISLNLQKDIQKIDAKILINHKKSEHNLALIWEKSN